MASKYDHRADVVVGWGDDISHYYVVEDMLKLDPGQLLYLFESATGNSLTASPALGFVIHDSDASLSKVKRGAVEAFVGGLGDWFENNGETLVETMSGVLEGRGEDLMELKEEVMDGGGVVA